MNWRWGLDRWGSCSLAAGVLALLAGCTGPTAVELRLGVVSWPGYEYFALARERQAIDPEVVALDLVPFRDQHNQVDAYVAGELDAIAVTSVDAVRVCGMAPRRCPVIVLVIDESRGADQLFGRPGLRDLGQLRGRGIALEDTGIAHYLLERAHRLAGLPPASQLRLVISTPEQWSRLLTQGVVDAVVSYAPFSEQLRTLNGAVPLFGSDELPGEILDVLAVDPTFARRHPDQVREVVEGWWTARRDERNLSRTIRERLARSQGLSLAQFESAQRQILYPGLHIQYSWLNPQGGRVAVSLEAIRRSLISIGQVPAETPVPQVSRKALF